MKSLFKSTYKKKPNKQQVKAREYWDAFKKLVNQEVEESSSLAGISSILSEHSGSGRGSPKGDAGVAMPASAMPIPEGLVSIPVELPDEVKEELKADNKEKKIDYDIKTGEALAKKLPLLDDEKIRAILIANGVSSPYDQDAIIKNVKRKNAGIETLPTPKEETPIPIPQLLDTNVQLPLMGNLRDGDIFIPRTGCFLAENINDAERINQAGSKPIIKKSKLMLVAVKQLNYNYKDLEKANETLANITSAEKTENNLPNGVEIFHHNPIPANYYSWIDGTCQR